MAKSNTYERIITAALQLFNEQGERNISTNHIATHLGISPGNLYYHFANKDEVIVQLFKRYSAELLGFLNTAELPRDIPGAVDYMHSIYDVMWRYRFLFSDVNTLLVRSNDLLGEHNEFTRERVAPLLIKLLSKMNDLGVIETDEIGMRDLSVNMWMVTKYWFDFDSSMRGKSKLDEQSKLRGVHRTLSLLRPYLGRAYVAQFDRVVAALD